MSDALLEVDNLSIEYETANEDIRAVSGVSFEISNNEYFGLVGESGSGKSTIAKSIIGGLDSNGRITGGTISFRGRDITNYTDREFREELRWDEISLIPQSSMNSLDPLMRLDKQAVELAQVHNDWGKEKAIARIKELFEVVGLPVERIYDYPHQFSGGMQQRAIIALSLYLEPSLIIADEPTTALDVIMQDQILKYLSEIKSQTDISMLMITHDISVIFENCDSLAVLHGGQVAETGAATEIFDNPQHPYSFLLQRSFPDIRHPDKELTEIEGHPPELRSDVNYCTFMDRCPWVSQECRESAPPLTEVRGTTNHSSSCIRREDIEMTHDAEHQGGDLG